MKPDYSRYQRQTGLANFGPEGQAKLAEARVLVVGLGGLGLPALQYLNAMGVGTLGLVEQDRVELHNLQRQVLYTEADVGRSKLNVTKSRLEAQNSETKIEGFPSFLNPENALEIIAGFDVVLDATDNFSTRYLINDACVLLNKPFVYGALHGFEGQVSVFNYKEGPTYRCLFPTMPRPHEVPNCNENGVLGIIPGIIGNLQALEVVKVLTGIGEVLSGQLLVFDGLRQEYRKINFPAIAENKKITALKEDYGSFFCAPPAFIGAQDFYELYQSNREVSLIDVRSEKEFDEFHLDASINIPLTELENYEASRFTGKPIYLICQSGKRSTTAQQQLQQRFADKTFVSVKGGLQEFELVCR